MSKKYVKFGAAWLKQTNKDGTEFISVATKTKGEDSYINKDRAGNKVKTKLWLQVEGNEPIQIEGFSVFPSNVDKTKYPTAPDFEVTCSFEE